jgi:hypothetical protein
MAGDKEVHGDEVAKHNSRENVSPIAGNQSETNDLGRLDRCSWYVAINRLEIYTDMSRQGLRCDRFPGCTSPHSGTDEADLQEHPGGAAIIL